MLDDKDKKLLKLMQADGRMTAKDASEQLDMSVPATAEQSKSSWRQDTFMISGR